MTYNVSASVRENGNGFCGRWESTRWQLWLSWIKAMDTQVPSLLLYIACIHTNSLARTQALARVQTHVLSRAHTHTRARARTHTKVCFWIFFKSNKSNSKTKLHCEQWHYDNTHVQFWLLTKAKGGKKMEHISLTSASRAGSDNRTSFWTGPLSFPAHRN